MRVSGLFPTLADDRNGLKKEFQQDPVHPNEAGYDAMAPLAEKAIALAWAEPVNAQPRATRSFTTD